MAPKEASTYASESGVVVMGDGVVSNFNRTSMASVFKIMISED
jgi:hypothetical protein